MKKTFNYINYRFILFVVSLFVIFIPSIASANGEKYQWSSANTVKVVQNGDYFSNGTFVAEGFALPSNAKGKAAYFDGQQSAPDWEPNTKQYVGSCMIYVKIAFLNKDGTLGRLTRYKPTVVRKDKFGNPLLECETTSDWYKNIPLLNRDIAIDRPPTLDTSTQGNTFNGTIIPQGCPGGPAGEKAPGIICPIPPSTSGTVTCGFLDQSLCDTVSNGLPTTDNPLGGIGNLIDYIINIVTGLFIIAVILIIVVSGVQISASAGNPEVIKNAKSHIFNAIVGIALLISARAIFSVFGIYDTGFAPPVTLFSKISRSNLSLNDFQQVLLNGIAIATFIAGIVSIIFLIVGGIQYIISSGNSERLKGAKNTVLYALVGLVISIMAYGIVTFVVDSLT